MDTRTSAQPEGCFPSEEGLRLVTASRQIDWLPQTKFYPPQLCSGVIPRPHLLAALDDALATHALTLVSAPAGYGKTTLLAALYEAFPALNLAWLSLDEDDNDPIRFLTAVVASLRRLNPACGAAAQALLDTSVSPWPNPGDQVRQVVGALINDILKTLPDVFALALDDLHLITGPTVYIALDYLLEHLPLQMHLVIATRHDPPLPLARLRAHGQLTELRLSDLRFTLAEATTLMNDRLLLNLSSDDLTALQSGTEGWPAGLRLLAASLEQMPASTNHMAFIARLTQTNRYVFDFLVDEVLSRQSPQVRTFLLETSILAELTPALCQAVTGREDAPAILEDLYRRSLFLAAMSDERPTTDSEGRRGAIPPSFFAGRHYRYHALFAEFLCQRLAQEMPERVIELHRQAAEAETVPARAINHYLAAQMPERAAQVVEQVGWQLLQRGLLTTLEDWLSAIPLSVRDARPSLDLYQASCALQRGESQAAQALLEHALQGFKASGDETGLGETLATLASCAFLQGDLERCGALIQQALVYPLSARAHVQLLMGRAWLHVFRHDWAQVQTDVVAALEAANQSGAADASLVIAFYLDPAFVSLPGLLEKIEHFCRQAATYCGDQIGPLQLALKELESFIHLWRGRMGETIQVGQSALEIHQRLGGYPFLGTDAAAWVAVASATQGDYATADRFFDLLTQMLARQVEQSDLIKTSQTTALYLVGRTRWLQGRLNEAHRIYGQMCMAENTPETPEAPVMRLIMRGLLEMAERRYAVAERTLRQATDLEEKIPISIVYGSARLMLAHLYLEWNHLHEALAELSPLLTECERQGVPGLVLKEGPIVVPLLRLSIAHGVHARFAARLLAMLDVDAGPAGPVRVLETGETLTPREAEILRLIVAGYSNHAIAERLVIGKPTVKSHVAHILQKLNVSSRTEAAARARELNLI